MNNETKFEIYKMLDEVEDNSILNAVRENVFFYTSEKDILEELSNKQLKELNEAISEADSNKTMSLSDFKKEIDKWKSK